MKLSTFQGANLLIVTQSAHGAAQGGCAFDFGWQGTDKVNQNIYAPCDGDVTDVWHTPGNDCYFNFAGFHFFIQFVHDEPLRKGSFKRGELLGHSVKDHHHVAIQVDGQWHWIFDYMDRSTDLYWWKYPDKNSKWATWAAYPTDLQLPDPTPPDPCALYKVQITELQNKLDLANARIIKFKTDVETVKSDYDQLLPVT